MRILKYVVFFSIFSGIFLMIYRTSTNKGFDRFWTSLKLAVIIGGILSGLISSPVETEKYHVNSTSTSMERLMNLSGGNQSKFGPGARGKSDARKNSKNSGILSLPSADGFIPNRNFKSSQKPFSLKRPAEVKKSPFDINPDEQNDSCNIEEEERSDGKRKGLKTYKIESEIDNSKKLTKISKKIRKNTQLVKEFKALERNLKNGNMKTGRGVVPLPNSNDIFYARGYTEGARLYFKYSGDKIIVIAESNKNT